MKSEKSKLQEAVNKEYELSREISKTELEIQNLEQSIKTIQAQIEGNSSKLSEHDNSTASLKQSLGKIDDQLDSLNEEMEQLQKEFKDIEAKAFKDFCKKLKVKNIDEFEQQQNLKSDMLGNGNTIFDKK